MLIDIRSLKAKRGDIDVLKDVRLSLQEGEIYGLLGPNGAGKSTTIAVALGMLPAQGGEVSVLGRNPAKTATALRARLGVLPELSGFYNWMTAADYLIFFAALHGHRYTETEATARLDRVGLAPRRRQTIGTFSRGMQQRLALARALIGKPALLILDEPTNGLDPRGRRDIHDILIDLSANHGVGILMSTHLLDDVDRLCHRIGILVDGRTLAEGPIGALTQEQHRRFKLRLASAPPIDALPPQIRLAAQEGDWCIVDLDPALPPAAAWQALLARNWPVTEIQYAGGGLEALYLGLTEGRPA